MLGGIRVEGVAWATVQEVAQAVILAQGGGPDLQDRFAAGPVVPELFGLIRLKRTWARRIGNRRARFENKGERRKAKGPRFPAENAALPFVRSGCSPAEPD